MLADLHMNLGLMLAHQPGCWASIGRVDLKVAEILSWLPKVGPIDTIMLAPNLDPSKG